VQANGAIEGLKLTLSESDHAPNEGGRGLGGFLEAVLFTCDLVAQMAAAIEQIGQEPLSGGEGKAWREFLLLGEAQDDPGVDPIGLGFDSFAHGKGAKACWVDQAIGDLRLGQGFEQWALIAAGGLADNQGVFFLAKVSEEFAQPGGATGGLERQAGGLDVEGVFADINGDEARVLHGLYSVL